ncbi:sensor histidine kinase [Dankookia rubra]|uniref:histidine kinase n=1 Tax=Dankookia rubra TaxID=1442381 RepID=A0A4R5QJ38_9PROT|nr:sensor histidine kinase [Dankookia rubra]TDH63063.1 sensor histidine kinase [Dankookia rubra]
MTASARHTGCGAARVKDADLTDDSAQLPASLQAWPILLRAALGIALALSVGAVAAAVPALGAAELQAMLLGAVALAALGLGLGAALAAAAAGFVWLLWPAAADGTLGTDTLLRALLWFALAKGIAAAIALPRGDLVRLASRLRGTEVVARERALLLEEMSHRIRNDMQRLVGLLQAEAGNNPVASGALLQAAGRIQVLGRVHRRLATRAGSDAVDSQAFLEGLVDDLRAALLPDSGIGLTVSAEPHALPVAMAGDLGLVVNELVTNALKYAFPRGKGGVVRVCFGREEKTYRLAVSDTGVGLGQVGLAAVEGGSGMRLVRALAAQLGGRVELRGGEVGGTLCLLRFPVAGPGRSMPLAEAPAEAPPPPERRSATS